MTLIVKPKTFSLGNVIVASEHNSNFDTIYDDYNGNIDNNNIKPNAAIEDTKLAQITTVGKVSIDAITPSFSGIIVLWSGSISGGANDIPTGWFLCDGNNGTPDLTDRFIIHADDDSGGTNNVGDTGGSRSISIANLPPHEHDYTEGNDTGASTADGVSGSPHRDSGNTTAQTSSVGSGTDYLPKFYALAYIMKS